MIQTTRNTRHTTPRTAITVTLGPKGSAHISWRPDVSLTVGSSHDERGQLVIDHLGITRSAGIGTRLLRDIPLTMVEAELALALGEHQQPSEQLRWLLQLAAPVQVDVQALPKAQRLGLVAQLYQELVRMGRPPAPAMADIFSIPTRTAHGWIAEARKAGQLPAARKGKAG